MSKSALYAGLGQGLMSLGNHVGEAYRMTAIEELRQQNLEQNWAREDKVRAEDRAYDTKKIADDRAWEAKRDKANREHEAAQRIVETHSKTDEHGNKVIEKRNAIGEIVEVDREDSVQSQNQTSTHQDLVNMGYTEGTPEYREAYGVLSGLAPNAAEKERLGKIEAQKAQDETTDQTLAALMGDEKGDGNLSRSAPIDGAAGWFDNNISTPIQGLWSGDGYIDNKTLARVASKLKSEALAAASGSPSDKDLELYAGSIPTPNDSEEVWKEWYRNEYLPRRQKIVNHSSGLGAAQTQNVSGTTPQIGRFKVVGVN